ncbi:pilus (MSHA type) biogenesis protein MshL [Halovibrio salipaludis]|uniref:Pilus (MSHA type) biogenesis protein MshL n=2 Tax=Halovibrio salipaludis TaxID=2032626 RepID=A0A2A2ETC0_9GAMM|nr:pilus (MSHA type) biogenesis protein MshL [Halovibrio salipaludis]
MQTQQASSTETTERIEEELEKAESESGDTEVAQAPDEVTGALMPDFSGGDGTGSGGEERFNVNAQGLAASTFFRSLVDGTPYNVVVDPAVEGNITLDLTQVTLEEVMEVVSDLYGYEINREGRIYRVRPAGLRTRVFQVDYLDIQRSGNSETQVRSGQVTDSGNGNSGASSDDGNSSSGNGPVVGTRITTTSESRFWADLRESLNLMVGSDNGQRVITNPGSGVVVVHARQDKLKVVEDYLRRMQLISKRQVILEARILEVELNESFQQGINWNAVDQMGTGNSLQGSLSSIATNTQGGGAFSAALEVNNFNSLIQLLGSQGNVQVLSSPRISTVNNEKAVIKVGSDEFFVTDLDFDDDTTAAAGTSRSTSVDLTPFFSGISLDVTPQISDEDVVTLHVHPSVSEVEDQEKLITIGDEDVTLPLALSTVRETDSVVRARSGQIVVIGGLIQDRTEETTSAVPFFSEIPVIGELFKQRSYESRKSELVILLKPMIANVDRYAEDVEDSQQRIRDLRRIMESTESPKPEPAAGAAQER